jgi:TPR repeat protein
MLGGMYEEGLGVKQSDSQALKFLSLACDLGLAIGCAESEKLKK